MSPDRCGALALHRLQHRVDSVPFRIAIQGKARGLTWVHYHSNVTEWLLHNLS